MIAELIKERQLPDFLSREEMLNLLQEKEYGYFPDIPYQIRVSDPVVTEKRYCDGKICISKVNMTVTTEFGSHTFPIIRALNTDGSVRPFIIYLGFGTTIPSRSYPTEEIGDAGFNVLTFNYQDVTKDNKDFTDGLPGIFMPNGRQKDTDCGKIMFWVWAAMRVMDYAQSIKCLDKNMAGVLGHSRLGKTALLTGAMDTRFRYVFGNGSGCSGAALTRGNSGLPYIQSLPTNKESLFAYEPEWGTGETIRDVMLQFPYWFCKNYEKYAITNIPEDFDQHFLLASVAPRFVYIGSGNKDLWADPTSEFLSAAAASAFYEKMGLPGLIHKDKLPEPEEVFHEGHVGYHARQGFHFLSRHDWQKYMAFMRKHQHDKD